MSVSTGFNAVHLIGQPIHHSANSGVNRKPATTSCKIPCGNNCVVSLHRAVCKLGFPESVLSALVGPRLSSDFNVGGLLRPRLVKVFPKFLLIAVARPSPLFCDAPFLFQFPQTVSVGSKEPPSISFMACADMRGCKRSVAKKGRAEALPKRGALPMLLDALC